MKLPEQYWILPKIYKKKNLKHPALTSGRNEVRSTLLFLKLLRDSSFFIFWRIRVFDFEIFEHLDFFQFSRFFQNLVVQMLNNIFHSYQLFGTRNRYYTISRSLHSCFRPILKFSIFFNLSYFHKRNHPKNYFRKNVSISRKANNYLNEDYKNYLLSPKWLWTDIFVRGYF